jgi:predicted DNA binding CopG/RHH family protein
MLSNFLRKVIIVIMNDLKLQPDELELLVSYENEEWQSVKNIKEQASQYQVYARATFRKAKRVNIRISENDLLNLQKRALREGIPYQTLISSVLHKYISGTLTER